MKNSLLTSLFLFAVLFAACSKDDDPTPPVNQKKVTYIVMVALDDGIAYSSEGKYDGLNPVLVEYPKASTELDQVVAVVNFNDKYRNENKIKGTEYYHYKNGKRTTLESTPAIEKIGEDSQYVTKIIDLAVKNAPADDYMLIFNSHGRGWDDIDAEDPISRSTLAVNDPSQKMGKSLSLNRLLKGYKNSILAQQGKKLKAVYYDNCLMHTIENLSEIAEIAEYSLGTPNVSISATQANTYLINAIRNSTDFESALIQTGAFINTTCAKEGHYMVVQACKLSEADKIPAKMAPLVNKIVAAASNPTKLEEMRALRSSTFCYNHVDLVEEEEFVLPLYDLGDYLFRFKTVLNDQEYNTLYEDFVATAKASLIYSVPTKKVCDLNRAGQLADGNTNYMFSILISSDIANSVYVQTGYPTLKVNTQGKWLDLLEKLNTTDSRLSDYPFIP